MTYPNARDCEHGRQRGKCADCDLADAEKEIARLTDERDKLAQELLTADVFSRLLKWLREPEPRRAVNAFTASIERQIAYALEMDVLPEVKRLRQQVENMREIEAAARNLCAIKGRHHSEIAMLRLMDACGIKRPNVKYTPIKVYNFVK